MYGSSFVFLLFVLIFSVLSSVDHPLFEHALAEDEHGDDEHSSSECTTNTLDALAHEFEHGRAYIQFHTDDGESPQNTGPGDLFTPGEIRGNIGPGDTDNIFTADINVDQLVLTGVDDTTPWDSVESSGTVSFNTGHHLMPWLMNLSMAGHIFNSTLMMESPHKIPDLETYLLQVKYVAT